MAQSDPDCARAASDLEYIETACHAAGVACATVCETIEYPYNAMLRVAKSGKWNLILRHSRGHKGLGAALLGSETRKVQTYSKIPARAVREEPVRPVLTQVWVRPGTEGGKVI